MSWPRLKAYVERLPRAAIPRRARLLRRPRERDRLGQGVSVAEARRDLAARHGFSSWGELRRHVEAMQSGEEPPTPFVLAYGRSRPTTASASSSSSTVPRPRRPARDQRQRPAWMASDLAIVSLLLERGPTPTAATTTAGRSCTRPAMGMMRAREADARRRCAHRPVRSRRWRHAAGRGAVLGPPRGRDLLGREPVNLRVAAGLGDSS